MFAGEQRNLEYSDYRFQRSVNLIVLLICYLLRDHYWGAAQKWDRLLELIQNPFYICYFKDCFSGTTSF